MAQLNFQINGTEKLSRNIRIFASQLSNMNEFYDDAIGIVQKYSKETFTSEGKPEPWKPLAPSTVRARQKRQGYYKQAPSGTPKILHWTGKLENSNKKTITNSFGLFEKTAPYAPYHQYGGDRLPQRKILTLDARAAAEIVRTLQKKINDDIGISGLQA